MAVNKNKIISLAQKYTAKGQFEKAIQEYRKLLKADPNDIRTWLKMGDLYTRMGARKEATETYLRVAEYYRKSDFHLKAVAVYKQVLKLDPTLIDVYELLGDAYMSLGLTSDAMIQFEQLADMYQRSDQAERMLQVLVRMAEIDPHNISTRLRIAEQFSKEGNNEGAVQHFTVACDQLRDQGRTDDFLKVAERLLYHDTSLIELAREVASDYLEKGQTKRALAKLQMCFSREPRNVKTLELLAQAFRGLNQPDKAVSVYLEIANILEEQNDEVERRRIFDIVHQLDPENQQANEGLGKKAPEQEVAVEIDDGLPSPALATSGAVPSTEAEPAAEKEADAAADLEELSDEAAANKAEKLLGEAEVLWKYGLADRAKEHIEKIFEFDFYNLDARERLKDIFLEEGNQEGAISQLFVLAEGFMEEQPEGSVYFLHQILAIDAYERRARDLIVSIGGVMPEGLPPLSDVEEMDAESLLDDIDVGGPAPELEPQSAPEPPAQVVEPQVQPEPEIEPEPVLEAEPATSAAASAEIDPSIDDVPYVVGDNEFSEMDLEGDEWGGEVLDLDAGDTIGDAADLDADLYAVVDENPEEVEVTSKPTPPPPPVPSRSIAPPPKRTVPPPPKRSVPPKVAAPVAPPRPPVKSERPKVVEKPPVEDVAPPAIDEDIADIAEELEEIEFFMSQGLEDEAKGIVEGLLVSFPDDPRVQDLEKNILKGGDAPSGEVSSSLDLDALAEDLGLDDITHDEVINEIDEVFSQFKAGVEQQVSQTDFATHYDLGVAYKEMGLFDDAIKEFQISLGDPTRLVSSQMMIGMCYSSSGRFADAVVTFEEGMEMDDLGENDKLALMYELAKAHEAQGHVEDAIEIFNEILNQDPGFADVVDRIDALESGLAGSGGQSVFS